MWRNGSKFQKKKKDSISIALSSTEKKGENLNKTRYNHSLNVLHDQLHNTHQSLKLHVLESWGNKTRQRIQRLTLTSDQVSYIARQAFSCFNMNKVKHLKNKKKRNCQISKFVSLSIQIFQKIINFYLHEENRWHHIKIVLIRKDKSWEKNWYQYFSLVFWYTRD